MACLRRHPYLEIMMIYDIFSTRFGDMMACGTEEALQGFYFTGQKYDKAVEPAWHHAPDHALLRELRAQFKAYEKQAMSGFDLPLDPQGTDFQKRVWRALLDIPAGDTSTYGAIAVLAASKAAVRAVGSAIGRNPISVIIPCHRVLGSSGSLTGYAGGLPRKAALLQHEGAAFLGIPGAGPPDHTTQDLFA